MNREYQVQPPFMVNPSLIFQRMWLNVYLSSQSPITLIYCTYWIATKISRLEAMPPQCVISLYSFYRAIVLEAPNHHKLNSHKESTNIWLEG